MKKTISCIMILAAAMAFVGCSNDDEMEVKQQGQLVFTATIDNEGVTRTAIENGTKVVWETGDEISVNGVIFTATSGGSASAEFTKKDDAVADPVAPYTVYYPASIYDASNSTATLPHGPMYNGENNIAINPMYATSSDTKLKFKNICGLLQITLKGTETIKSLTLLASNVGMAGPFTVNANNEAVLNGASAGTEKRAVLINCGASGESLTSEGKKFYVALPVGTYKDLSIWVKTKTDSDNNTKTWKVIAKKDAVIERNKIYPMSFTPDFQAEQEPKALDLGLSVLWADCNVGAAEPCDFGNWYAWGELTDKYYYAEDNYQYQTNKITTNLTSDKDVAAQKWGNGWRMPTLSEASELDKATTKQIIFKNGMYVYELSFSNGEKIYFPIVKHFSTAVLMGNNGDNEYWTSTYWSSYYGSYAFSIGSSIYTFGQGHSWGYPIRPVKDMPK